jgi:hypothetical protein
MIAGSIFFLSGVAIWATAKLSWAILHTATPRPNPMELNVWAWVGIIVALAGFLQTVLGIWEYRFDRLQNPTEDKRRRCKDLIGLTFSLGAAFG